MAPCTSQPAAQRTDPPYTRHTQSTGKKSKLLHPRTNTPPLHHRRWHPWTTTPTSQYTSSFTRTELSSHLHVCLSALHAGTSSMTSKAEASIFWPGDIQANCSQCGPMHYHQHHRCSQSTPSNAYVQTIFGLQLHCNYRSILKRPTTHVRHIWHTGRTLFWWWPVAHTTRQFRGLCSIPPQQLSSWSRSQNHQSLVTLEKMAFQQGQYRNTATKLPSHVHLW